MADSVDLTVRLIDDATRPARRMSRAIDGINRPIERINRSVGKMSHGGHGGGGLGGIFQMAAGMATGMAISSLLMGVVDLAKGVVSLTAKFTAATFSAAMFRETAVNSFRALSKGTSDGSKEFERVRDLAFQFGVPLEDVVEQFVKLRRMGFEMGDVERMFKRFQDMKAVGVTTDQIRRAVEGIAKIKATGVLQGDELMIMAEAGISVEEIYKSLGKRLKKTVPEIVKLKEAGKITAADAIASIEDAMGIITGGKAPGKLGEDFAENTISGMFQRLKNAGGVLLDEIAKRITPAFKALKPVFEDTFKFIQGAEGKAIFDQLGKGFAFLFGAIRDAWPFVKQFLSGLKEGFGEGWTQGMKAMEPALKAFKAAMGDETQMKNFALAGQAVGFAIGFMAAGFITIVTVVAAAWAWIAKLVGKIRELFTSVTGLSDSLKSSGNTLGSSLVDGFIAAMTAGVERVRTAAKNLASAATGGLSSSLGFGSGSGTGSFGVGGIPTSGWGLGSMAAASAGGGSSTSTYAPQTSISVTGVEGKDLAGKIRTEVERALLQKFGGASP